MTYDEIVAVILGAKGANFRDRGTTVATHVAGLSTAELRTHLLQAGTIPESLHHDSSEEKLYAKYCDHLLVRALLDLGFATAVLDERADAADVTAKSPDPYVVVGDAKAFRLSRTAKNQKDFKVGALNSWRKGAEYAALVAPLFQYPSTSSQIYRQAIDHNVTLLSYTHLVFLLDKGVTVHENPIGWRGLWNVGASLDSGKNSKDYWSAIDGAVAAIAGSAVSELAAYRDEMHASVNDRAQGEVAHWEAEKKAMRLLTKAQAISQLIKARKIDEKIKTIQRSAGKSQ